MTLGTCPERTDGSWGGPTGQGANRVGCMWVQGGARRWNTEEPMSTGTARAVTIAPTEAGGEILGIRVSALSFSALKTLGSSETVGVLEQSQC